MAEYHPIKIGDMTIGGPFGSKTGLAVGSIFYDKHSIVTDSFTGEFDLHRAEALVHRVNALSERYGVQMGFDVIASTAEAMEKFLEFVGSRTRLPLLINATEAEVRLAGLDAAAKLGVLRQCIYASLNEDTEGSELESLARQPPATVMVLASDIGNPTPEGTCDMLESFFHPMLKEIGVTAPIVDVGTMDAPSIGLNLASNPCGSGAVRVSGGMCFLQLLFPMDRFKSSRSGMGRFVVGCRLCGLPVRRGGFPALRHYREGLSGGPRCRHGRSVLRLRSPGTGR